MLYAADNKLSHLPHDFRYLHRLESLFLQHNKIKSLDGTLQNARRLKFLELSYNSIQEVFFPFNDLLIEEISSFGREMEENILIFFFDYS